MTTPRILPFLLIASMILITTVTAGAQQFEASSMPAQPDDSEPFFESVDVTLVNVEVFVTDRHGNRVRGLTIDDFEVFEEGKPVRITNFFAVDRGRPVLQPTADPTKSVLPTDSAPAVVKPRPRPVAPRRLPENQRLSLILYFDNLYLRPFNRNKVADKVREFMHLLLEPDDQVMLVTFDRSLHVRHTFTSDKNAIDKALEGIEKLSGFAIQAASQRQEVIRRIEQSRSSFEALDHADFYAKNIYFEVNESIKALKEVVLSMAGLPGRKALLYVSDGLPMKAAEDLFSLVDLRFPNSTGGLLQASRYKSDRRFRQLTSLANSNRVTFYTIEAAGLRSHASLSAEYGGNIDKTSMLEIDVTNVMNMQTPLLEMALETGGLATINTNNFRGGMARMAEDFKSFYSLGYVPVHAGDGRYYHINVKTKDRSFKIRHRDGYRSKSPETQITEGTLAVLFFGRGVNHLGFKADFEAIQSRDDDHFLVPLLVRIPLGALTLIPRNELHQGSLQITVAARGDDGRVSPVDLKRVPIIIPDTDLKRALEQEFVYEIQLLMRRGSQEIAIGVYDEFSRQSSYLRRRLQVGG
ncbi:MAG: VWA domain-containing protein [Thermoanaerobaculia bacterium]